MKRFQMIGVVAVAAAFTLVGCGKKDDKAPAGKTDDKTPAGKTDDKATAPAANVAPTPQTTPGRASATGDAVTMNHVVEPVGMTWSEEDTMTMSGKVAAQGQEMQVSNNVTKNKKIEVLAVSAKTVTKAKVTYSAYSNVQKQGPREATTGAAVVGKTYVLESKDDKIKVTLDGGGEPSAEEIALVMDDNKSFGKPSVMGTALHGTTFKIGEKTAISPEKLAAMFGGADGKMEATSIDMTLTEIRGKKAVFLMEVMLKGGSGPMNIEINMKGTAIVDSTTTGLHDLDLEGGMTFSGAAVGTGTMTGHKAVTY